jgi:hypothetical protein
MPADVNSPFLLVPRPYTFVPVTGHVQLWDAPERRSKGVYLWTIEHAGEYCINYVGKTSCRGGFEVRIWQELKDWRKGRYLLSPVDLDAFTRGERLLLADRPYGHHQRELALLEPLYRIFLIPIDADAETDRQCRSVENSIVNALRANSIYFAFLANRDKESKYPSAEASLSTAGIRLRGLR